MKLTDKIVMLFVWCGMIIMGIMEFDIVGILMIILGVIMSSLHIPLFFKKTNKRYVGWFNKYKVELVIGCVFILIIHFIYILSTGKMFV